MIYIYSIQQQIIQQQFCYFSMEQGSLPPLASCLSTYHRPSTEVLWSKLMPQKVDAELNFKGSGIRVQKPSWEIGCLTNIPCAKLTWLAGIFPCFNWKYIFNWSILEPGYVRLIVGLCVFCSITVLFLNFLKDFLTSNDGLWSCVLWVNYDTHCVDVSVYTIHCFFFRSMSVWIILKHRMSKF